MYRSVLRGFTFVCLSLLAPLIALAHHAFNSDYDMSDIAEVAGRVTEVRWANPHTIITVEGRERRRPVAATCRIIIPNCPEFLAKSPASG